MAKQDFNGEILHFNAVRMRLVGLGDLQLSLISLDDVNSNTLNDVTMAGTTNREPTALANFSEQRACLFLGTTEIEEWFNISKITIFVKPVATGYPQ